MLRSHLAALVLAVSLLMLGVSGCIVRHPGPHPGHRRHHVRPAPAPRHHHHRPAPHRPPPRHHRGCPPAYYWDGYACRHR